MSRARCGRFRWSIALAVSLTAERGLAQAEGAEDALVPALPSDTDQARDAFRQGSTLAKQGRWADALLAFRESARLRPHPVTTYNVAYCERALGHHVAASLGFSAALAPPALPGFPELSPDLAAQARSYRADAERGIAKFEISLTARVAIRVDGFPLVPIRPGTEGTEYVVSEVESPEALPLPPRFTLWLDPGTHVFVVVREGGAQDVERHQAASGGTASLSFPRETRMVEALPVASPSPSDVDRTWAYVAFGVGAAGLVGSGVFAGLTLRDQHTLDSDPLCRQQLCPDNAHYRDVESRMRLFADLATVGIAVAAAGAAVGGYLWFTARPPRAAVSTSPSGIRPWVGVGSAGVAGRF